MPINHVVVLLLENRAFDHILGDIPGVDGIDRAHPRANSFKGKEYLQQPGAARIVTPDPRHEFEHVITQTFGGLNAGFVEDFGKSYPNTPDAQLEEVMRYHARGALPALHRLAETYTVCDRWFAPVPGPTWPNRLFAMSGTSLGRITMPEGVLVWNVHWYSQTTIFDRLNEKRKNWKLYYGDFPLSFLLVHNLEPENVARHHHMDDFYKDAAGNPADFPDFAWIEPEYFPPGANDAHPPHDIQNADRLVASVYNALRRNETLWKETLLVVLFDEHGGFYDHVPPGKAIAPDANRSDGFDFSITGVRVPAILVSPFAAHKTVSTQFDHTSLLKYLIDKWALGPLYARTAQANTFAGDLLSAPRPDSELPPELVQAQDPAPAAPVRETPTRNQNGLIAMSRALESLAGESDAVVAARNKAMLSSAQSQFDAALDRLDGFVLKSKARAS